MRKVVPSDLPTPADICDWLDVHGVVVLHVVREAGTDDLRVDVLNRSSAREVIGGGK